MKVSVLSLRISCAMIYLHFKSRSYSEIRKGRSADISKCKEKAEGLNCLYRGILCPDAERGVIL